MSTNRLISPEVELVPPEVDFGPPELELPDELGNEIVPHPKHQRLTPDERAARAELVSGYVAHLEQTPTSELSSAALQRLTLLAIEVSGADPLGGGQGQPILGGQGSQTMPTKKTSVPRRKRPAKVDMPVSDAKLGRPARH